MPTSQTAARTHEGPSASATLGEVVAVMDALYAPAWAESWDAVGLVCGDPEAPVRRVHFAIDPVLAVAEDAVAADADLLVTHHPLLLRGVHAVAASTPKGRVVHTLIRAGVGLLCAHTNADAADPGVSDALAAAIGLRVLGPLAPAADDPGRRRGIGRVCELPEPEPVAALAARVARALPATAGGVRFSGDPDRTAARVAVCGGAGDSLLETARAAGVDAYITADLRHHPASEASEAGGPALIDVAHWASEHPWLAGAAAKLTAALAAQGTTVETTVSHRVTDPWTGHAASEGSPR